MTADFIHDFCQSKGYKLYMIEPFPKFVYASHVLENGFPAAPYHRLIMGKLKYKTIRDFALTINRKDHCMVSGVRKFESTRRFNNYPEPIQTDGRLWFCCPYFYKTDEEIYKEFMTLDIPISPAYKLGFSTSGDCLCGSYAAKHEKQLIRDVDPKLADYIEWLEDGVQRFGTAHAKRYSKWGDQAKMSEIDSQKMITKFFQDNPDLVDVATMELVTCGSECGPGTLRGMTDFL